MIFSNFLHIKRFLYVHHHLLFNCERSKKFRAYLGIFGSEATMLLGFLQSQPFKKFVKFQFCCGGTSRVRTCDQAVMSRALYL